MLKRNLRSLMCHCEFRQSPRGLAHHGHARCYIPRQWEVSISSGDCGRFSPALSNRFWRALLLLACVAIGAMTLDVVVKFAIARSRPPAEWMIVPASGWAFPSSHTTQATAVYGAVAYLATPASGVGKRRVGDRHRQLLGNRLLRLYFLTSPRSPLAFRPTSASQDPIIGETIFRSSNRARSKPLRACSLEQRR